MQTSGFADQLLDIHRDGNAFLSVRQATIASLKTGLAMAFPHLMGTVTLRSPLKSSEF